MAGENSKSLQYMIEKLDDIAARVSLLADKFDALRETYQVEHVKVVSEAARAHTRLDLVEKEQAEIQKEIRETYRVEHGRVALEAARAHSRLDEVERDRAEIQKELREIVRLMPWVKALAFLTMGLSIPVILAAIGFIWAVLTHQVALFPSG